LKEANPKGLLVERKCSRPVVENKEEIEVGCSEIIGRKEVVCSDLERVQKK
jgi:hypothetical protein